MKKNILHQTNTLFSVEDFGKDRPQFLTFWMYFKKCLSSPFASEKNACYMGITKSEYDEFTEKSLNMWRWMWAVAFLLLIAVFAVISIYGSGSQQVGVFGIIAAMIILPVLILVFVFYQVDKGLESHAVNFEY